MNNQRHFVLSAATLIAMTMLIQYLMRRWDPIFVLALTNAALMIALQAMGLRYAIAVAILIPWMSAVPELIQPVLTYPMIISNLCFVLLFFTLSGSKQYVFPLLAASLAEALILRFLSVIVISTWLEPHLQLIGSVNHGTIQKMLHALTLWRQTGAALLGGGAVLAGTHLLKRFQTKS